MTNFFLTTANYYSQMAIPPAAPLADPLTSYTTKSQTVEPGNKESKILNAIYFTRRNPTAASNLARA